MVLVQLRVLILQYTFGNNNVLKSKSRQDLFGNNRDLIENIVPGHRIQSLMQSVTEHDVMSTVREGDKVTGSSNININRCNFLPLGVVVQFNIENQIRGRESSDIQSLCFGIFSFAPFFESNL